MQNPASLEARRAFIATDFGLEGEAPAVTNLHHSVPRDDWCCGAIAAPIEPIIQADPHDVELLATSIDDYARTRGGLMKVRLLAPRSAKRYSPLMLQLLRKAYSTPAPTV